MSTKNNGHPRSKLFLRTLELLKDRSRTKTLDVISADTGLPRYWLISIMGKPEMSPSVDRVERLYEYLSGSILEVH